NLTPGATLQFNASGGAPPYNWGTSNSAVATIDGNGLLTAVAPGNITVTAVDADGIAGNSGTVTVTPGVLLTVTPEAAVIIAGNTLAFSASGGAGILSWSSSNPTVASINNLGVLTALLAGSVTVSASDGLGNTGSSGSIRILATAPTISITPNITAMTTGTSQQFTATGGSAAPYTWSIDNGAVAGIDPVSGLLVARAAGSVVVTASDANGFTGSTGTITITNAINGITVTPQVASVRTGATLQFSASGGNGVYAWSVSNSTSAAIDGNGLLTGLIAGTLVVSATDSNGVSGSSGNIIVTAGGGMHR
ncbi:MAG: Ig-like domain-containing protein, partial [Nitrospira sp.]|nr:Ig-like domain-containing protein [Nitrospira sp.]